MRKVLGIIIGAVTALAIFAALGWISDQFYPPTLDIDIADETTLASIIADKTMVEKLLWVAPWLLASFGGAWLALRISDWKWAGWIVSALILVIALMGILDLPHPLWMQACAVALPILGGWLAARIHHKPYPGEPLLG
ncbi:MAG: hypothetical protein ABIO86_06085 [Sphingomonas sp.]